MQSVQMFRVQRPPLRLPDGPKIHRGIAARNNAYDPVVVLHNTPEKGEHLGTLEEFAAGLELRVEPIVVTEDKVSRFNSVAANPQSYDLLTNNCEQTAAYVEEGKRWSETLAYLAGIVVVTGLAIWAISKAKKS